MLHAHAGWDANRNQVILEEHLDLHRAVRRRGRGLGNGAGLAVHGRGATIGVGCGCWGTLLGYPLGGGIDLLLRRLARHGLLGIPATGVLRSTGEPGILAKRIGVDFEVAFTGREEFAHELTTRNMRGHRQELLDVFVQVLSSAVGNRVRDVGDRTRHEREGSPTATVASFVFKLSQKGDLKVVEIVVITRQLPAATVFHLRLDDVPILVVIETVARDVGGDGDEQLVALLRHGHL